MITVSDLDKRIAQVDLWVPQAAQALLSLWDKTEKVLVPDSGEVRAPEGHHRAVDDTEPSYSGDELEKTAIRALWALVDYLRWAREEETVKDTTSALVVNATDHVKSVADRWFAALLAKKDEREHDPSMLTDSYLLSCIALLDALYHTAGLTVKTDAVAAMHTYACGTVAHRLVHGLLAQHRGAVVVPEEEPHALVTSEKPHDFITLHAIRALDSLRDRVPDRKWADDLDHAYTQTLLPVLADRVREDVLRQLGYYQARMLSRFDPAELAYSAVLLSRLSHADVVQLVQPALRTVLSSQTADGAWPTVRMVDVPSMEVALALVATLARDVEHGRFDFASELLPALDRALDLVGATHVVAGELRGWMNDRRRSIGAVQRWPTARVLSFTVRYADVLRAWRQRLLLANYRADEPRTLTEWPDLEPTYRVPPPLAERALDSYSDPTQGAQLTACLRKEILKPITDDLVQRPKVASLILHGPPGTRKTSLARALAQALGWPFLTLSPPTFLSRDGLNGFEAAADAVFHDLLRLRRVVVLFDECEEFFLERPKPGPVEQRSSPQSRTVGAFITAGMLPRLQDLRNQCWVLFVLATNYEPAALDPAVTRPGRFDYGVLVDHPVLDAQARYVTKKDLPQESRAALMTALEHYDDARREETPRLSFGAIDSVARALKDGDLEAESRAVFAELKRLADSAGPRPLY